MCFSLRLPFKLVYKLMKVFLFSSRHLICQAHNHPGFQNQNFNWKSLTWRQWYEAKEKLIKVSQFENCTWRNITFISTKIFIMICLQNQPGHNFTIFTITSTLNTKSSGSTISSTSITTLAINYIFTMIDALFLLVLWRLRVEAGGHWNPSVGSRNLEFRFSTHCVFFSIIFTLHHVQCITSTSWKSHQQGSKRSKNKYFVSILSII